MSNNNNDLKKIKKLEKSVNMIENMLLTGELKTSVFDSMNYLVQVVKALNNK